MIRVRTAKLSDAKGYHACLDVVARERAHLALVTGLPLERARNWMRSVLRTKCPFLVVTDGGRVVGWCDMALRDMEGFRHTVGLGMGLLPEMRGRGLGAQMLKLAIAQARKRRIEKIELQVFASNRPARELYRKFGFLTEGRRARARKIDGKYDDIIHMGKLL